MIMDSMGILFLSSLIWINKAGIGWVWCFVSSYAGFGTKFLQCWLERVITILWHHIKSSSIEKKKRWYMLHLHYIIASTAYLIFVIIFWCDHCCWNIPIHQPHVLPCTIMHRETWLLKNEFISKRRDEFIFFPPTPYIFVFFKKNV